jgi:hypothetical protein
VKSKETCGRRVGKCILAGLVGGLIGTILMMEFQNAWSAASQNVKEVDRGQQSGSDQNEQSQQEKESTTMKAAGKLGEIAGYPLSHEQKKEAWTGCPLFASGRFRVSCMEQAWK